MCKKLNAFLQNLRNTTTVLQQLQICIDNIKDVLKIIDTTYLTDTRLELHNVKLRINIAGSNYIFGNIRFLIPKYLEIGKIESYNAIVDNFSKIISYNFSAHTIIPTDLDYVIDTLRIRYNYWDDDNLNFEAEDISENDIIEIEDTIIDLFKEE